MTTAEFTIFILGVSILISGIIIVYYFFYYLCIEIQHQGVE